LPSLSSTEKRLALRADSLERRAAAEGHQARPQTKALAFLLSDDS
jgi:hypothetical protein